VGRERCHEDGKGKGQCDGRGMGARRGWEGKGAMRMGRERGHGSRKGKVPSEWEVKRARRMGRERGHGGWKGKGP
jgi:hypothetical protein